MGIKRNIKNYLVLKKERRCIESLIKKNPTLKKAPTILFVDYLFPRSDHDSGARRMVEWMKATAGNYNVVFMKAQKVGLNKEEYGCIEDYQKHEIGFVIPFVDANGRYINKKRFLKMRYPNITHIVISRPKVYKNWFKALKKLYPNAHFIYDMVDVYHIRMQRELELNTNSSSKAVMEMKEFETKGLNVFDKIIAISDEEKEYMSQFYDIEKIFTISNFHQLVEIENVKPFEERKNFLFIGSFNHSPNIDAIRFLYHEIFPLVQTKNPAIGFEIIGAGNIPEDILEMDQEHFKIRGFVKDVSSFFLQSIAMVAPLRFGAGVKGKIGQALEYGLPVITSEIGNEGIHLVHDESALIVSSSSPQDFAKEIIRLSENAILWEEISVNSLNYIKKFTPESQKKIILEVFEK